MSVSSSALLARLALFVALLLLGAGSALAQTCAPVVRSAETLQKWYNPHPDPTDVALPLPGGVSLIFTPVPLGSSQVWGNEKSTYNMGSSELRVFETPLKVRVGSSIRGEGATDQAELLLGKYEFTKGQYVNVIGNGDLNKGIADFATRTGDPDVKAALAPYLDAADPCHGVLTAKLVNLLAEPLTFMKYSDYVAAIESINLYCINLPRCRKVLTELGPNPDFPGFVRLPSEPEWEFVARGGGAFVAGTLSRDVLQADVPYFEPGKGLANYANIDNLNGHLSAIGAKEPLFGFYDMIGNAEELMQNPFTSENGFGAVGAYVARGGHYRMALDDFRVSIRRELTVFRRNDTTNEFFAQAFPTTGMRLMIGLPVVGATGRTGSDELAQWFREGWEPVDVAGDIAGASTVEANDLGRLAAAGLHAKDEVSGNDKIDFFAFRLLEYGTVNLEVTNATAPVRVSIVDDDDSVYFDKTQPATGAAIKFSTANLLPRQYYLKVEAAAPGGTESQYDMALARTVAPDTGIERPSTQDLAKAVLVTQNIGSQTAGFVGDGDKVDTYPVSVNTALGGFTATLTDFTGTVTLKYLNDRQKTLAEVTSGGTDKTLQLVAPVDTKLGFLQVVAGDRTSTTYKLAMQSKQLFDPVFVTSVTATGPSALAKHPYQGYLSTATPRLILPVSLSGAMNLTGELTDLTADVDLDILDSRGARQAIDSKRDGLTPEFANIDLAAGRYFLQVTLGRQQTAAAFKLQYSTSAATRVADDPAALRQQANALGYLSDYATTRIITKTGTQYFSFQGDPSGQLVLDADLSGFTPSADLDLFLEDATGNVLARSNQSGGTAENIKFTVNGSGPFYLRIGQVGTSQNVYASLQVSAFPQMKPVDTSGWGSYQTSFEDWTVYRNGDTCTMISNASYVKPALGWRRTIPYFYISVTRGKDSINIALDTAAELDGTDLYSDFQSYVYHSNGSRESIVSSFEKYWMYPEPKGAANLPAGIMVTFRRGSSMSTIGKTKDGVDAQVDYSLSGYTKAAQTINSMCGANASWIYQ